MKIYQISFSPIEKEDYLTTEGVTYEGEYASLSYAYNLMPGDETEAIKFLAEQVLPKGMFTLNLADRSLTYNGGMPEWKEQFLLRIKVCTEILNIDNIMTVCGPLYTLEKAIKNPLQTRKFFVMDYSDGTGLAELSGELMTHLDMLRVGDKIHIGAVLGYHI